jgi:membrane protein YqaA with SNARE-associated domain
MLRRLYDWTLSLAASRHATKALAGISFIESSIFPIPPDVLLVPMVLADRDRWLRHAAICTIASVLGAYLGYAIGALLYDTVGRPVLAFYGMQQAFDDIAARYNSHWGTWAILIGAVTPFPYKVLTIFSGVTGLSLVTLTVFSIVGRGLRFFLTAWLLWRFGPPIRAFIEQHLGKLFTLFVIVLIGGFLGLRYVL